MGKHRMKKFSIPADEMYLAELWKQSSNDCELNVFCEAWAEVSRSIGCPKGYILLNTRIDTIKTFSSFPEVTYEIIEDMVGDQLKAEDLDQVDTLAIVDAHLRNTIKQ